MPLTTLRATKDNYLDEGDATNNNGTAATIDISTVVAASDEQPIFEFDLSTISQRKIIAAHLWLDVVTSVATTLPIELLRIVRTDWTEAGSTWNLYDGISSWSTAGAGNDGADHDSGVRTTDTIPTSFTGPFQVISALAHVIDAIANRSNQCIVMLRGTANAPGEAWDFRSLNATSNPNTFPRLVVKTGPEPRNRRRPFRADSRFSMTRF